MPDMVHDFSVAPGHVSMKRSTFDMPFNHKLTANFGELFIGDCVEVLPGDDWQADTKMLARMSTPLYPVMDNAWINYYYFFVPARLVWSSFAEFLGENKLSAWAPASELTIPHAKITSQPGSVADQFGIPTYSSDAATLTKYGLSQQPSLDVNFLPFRCYQLIWNEWFRNENTTDPILVNTGDNVTNDEKTFAAGDLLKVEKPFDYFTACLPGTQKGNAAALSVSALLPLVNGDPYDESKFPLLKLRRAYAGGESFTTGDYMSLSAYVTQAASSDEELTKLNVVAGDDLQMTTNQGNVAFDNLYADLSNQVHFSVNDIRQAFQMQRFLELQARGGTRLTEIIRASFSTVSEDARLQRPEFLSGGKVRIQMQQVTQQSSTDATSPLGHTGAFSKTVTASRDFRKGFSEHGYIICVGCARHALTYQQGLERMWQRRGRFDLYWPTFAFLSEQPIYKSNLMATGIESGPNKTDNQVFGYNEAWIEYRSKLNRVSGAFRSTVATNLDEWHYADDYTTPPTLSDTWMHAGAAEVDRTLAVTSAVHDQLLIDLQIDYKATRVMPLYSVPGLVDHF